MDRGGQALLRSLVRMVMTTVLWCPIGTLLRVMEAGATLPAVAISGIRDMRAALSLSRVGTTVRRALRVTMSEVRDAIVAEAFGKAMGDTILNIRLKDMLSVWRVLHEDVRMLGDMYYI